MNIFWKTLVGTVVFFAVGFAGAYFQFAWTVYFAAEGEYIGYPHNYWSWYPSGQLGYTLICALGYFAAHMVSSHWFRAIRWRDTLISGACAAVILIILLNPVFMQNTGGIHDGPPWNGFGPAVAIFGLGIVVGLISVGIIAWVARNRAYPGKYMDLPQ